VLRRRISAAIILVLLAGVAIWVTHAIFQRELIRVPAGMNRLLCNPFRNQLPTMKLPMLCIYA